MAIAGRNATDGVDTTLSVFATSNSSGGGAKIFLSNFRPDDGTGDAPAYAFRRGVTLTLHGLSPATRTATVSMINSTCANPKRVWVERQGSVNWPDAGQLAQLHEASEACVSAVPVVRSAAGVATVVVELEAYAAAAVQV